MECMNILTEKGKEIGYTDSVYSYGVADIYTNILSTEKKEIWYTDGICSLGVGYIRIILYVYLCIIAYT